MSEHLTAAGYPRFSEGEMARRTARVREYAREQGLDALVVYGNSAQARTQQADVQYLSNFGGMRENYLLLPCDGEPVLLVQSSNHVPNAREISVLPDTRWGGEDSAVTLAGDVRRRGLRRLGLVGRLPYQDYLTLRAQAPETELCDATPGYRLLRLTKSDEELAWLRRGAAYCDAACAALEREVRPGLREDELGAIVESAYLQEGGQTLFHYIGRTPMRGSERCVPAQFQSPRRIAAGDVLTWEISVSYWGYAGQVLRTMTVGEGPTPEYAALHDVALQAYERVAPIVRPGVTAADVLDAADFIAERGYSVLDGLLHGYGIGLLPPSIYTRQVRPEPPPFTFEENMTLVLQPNVVTPDHRKGVQVGNLGVVTARGLESLHHYPTKLIVAGA